MTYEVTVQSILNKSAERSIDAFEGMNNIPAEKLEIRELNIHYGFDASAEHKNLHPIDFKEGFLRKNDAAKDAFPSC